MTDADPPVPSDRIKRPVDSATADSEQTLPPGQADTHSGAARDQTIQPSGSAGNGYEPAEQPVDQTIPPSAAPSSAASAETSAEPANDQTLQPAGSPQAEEDLESNQFGDYEIIQEIARGGMGVVYKARQLSLNRTVALKKILSGQLAGEEDLKRFQIEAEASAQLDHVGIVPVYDFGQVDGQYYFSMGFVEGDDLAERIRERPMEAEAAAAMMIKIAQAVGYANAQGVIHRDLKPSNVLLDPQNEPKVTDFGVAKQQGNDSEMTAQGQILGTPSYMPPEQAAGQGEAVDQRSDVYALGAILYALLTGRPPFQAATAMETMIQVLDQEPVPISQLNASIPRDLETVCLKCLQKDPAKRYASAEALADDLQRYLSDEPIVARPPTRTEQLGRWVRKNRATAIASGVVAAALIVATIISISFAVEAGRQRDVASGQRDAAELAKEEADQQRTIAEAKTAEVARKADEMQVMVDFQAEQLSGIDVPAMGASLKTKMLKELNLDPAAAWGADFTGASLQLLDEHIFGPALQAIDERFADQPLVQAKLLQTMAATLADLGLLEGALPPQQLTLEIRRRELGDEHPDTLISINNLAALYKEQGKYREAEPLMRDSLETKRRTLGDEHPDTLTSISNLAALFSSQGKYGEAESHFREVLEIRRRELGDEHSSTLISINNLGLLFKKQGKYGESEPLMLEALEAHRRTLGDEHPSTLLAINNLGVLFEEQAKHAEAEPLFREVLEAKRRTLGDEHPTTLLAINNLGMFFFRQRHYVEAEPLYREALEAQRRTLGDGHPSTLISINNLAALFRNQGKLTEAALLYREAMEAFRRTLGDEHPNTLTSISNLGALLRSQGKYVEAESLMREALEAKRRTLGDEHPATLVSINNLGVLFYAQGKYGQAEPLYREALKTGGRTLGDKHPYTVHFQKQLADVLAARKAAGDKQDGNKQDGNKQDGNKQDDKKQDDKKQDDKKQDDKKQDGDKKDGDKKDDKKQDDKKQEGQHPEDKR